ncbi:MAG: hypothetical protein JWR26_372 [Pedosphaera sp.]|nr:hypothetical protein [Pedosphaera sp.]
MGGRRGPSTGGNGGHGSRCANPRAARDTGCFHTGHQGRFNHRETGMKTRPLHYYRRGRRQFEVGVGVFLGGGRGRGPCGRPPRGRDVRAPLQPAVAQKSRMRDAALCSGKRSFSKAVAGLDLGRCHVARKGRLGGENDSFKAPDQPLADAYRRLPPVAAAYFPMCFFVLAHGHGPPSLRSYGGRFAEEKGVSAKRGHGAGTAIMRTRLANDTEQLGTTRNHSGYFYFFVFARACGWVPLRKKKSCAGHGHHSEGRRGKF